MFKIPRRNPWPPVLDLSTVRETIAYMHDDMSRVPGLEGVASALETALEEIDAAERKPKPAVTITPFIARFLPRRY